MLKTTTKHGIGRGSHYHIIYLKPGEQEGQFQGITSLDNNHTHASENDIETLPAPDGHTHAIIEIDIADETDSSSENAKTQRSLALYREGMDRERKSRDNAYESVDFYQGKHWDDEEVNSLEANSRAALTINEIESKIDVLSGFQRQNRHDIKFLPVEGSDNRMAEILTILTKNIQEQNNFSYEETEVFEDGMIAGRGIFNAYIDYDKNVDGDVIIEKFNWDDVVFGPHEKKDISDCEWLVKTKWFSLNKLKNLFPEKADKLQSNIDIFRKDEFGEPIIDAPGHQYDFPTEVYSSSPDKDIVDIAKQEMRVVELWEKVYRIDFTVLNIADDFIINAEGWKKSDVNKAKTIPGFAAIPRKTFKMKVTAVGGHTFLEEDFPDLAVQDFDLIPFYVKKRGDDWWGKIESVKDLQREINKRHSQAIDILNKSAAYGWFYDNTTFNKPSEERNFIETSSQPGFAVKVTDITRMPQKVDGTKFPSEIVNMMAIDSDKMKEIMNVNQELMERGKAGTPQSGIAIAQQKQSMMIGNEYLFDNLSLAKRKLGRHLVAMIQKVYTPERIMRVLESRSLREAIKIGGEALFPQLPPEVQDAPVEQKMQMVEQLVQMKQAELMEIITTSDLSKFDVVVTESPHSATTRQANFVIWADMASKGFPVPPDLLVDLSDLPEKDVVKQNIQAQQQAAQAESQRESDTEIQKTLIAAQSRAGGGAPQGGQEGQI